MSNLSGGNNRNAQDRYQTLTQAGIAPNVSVILSNVSDATANSNDTTLVLPTGVPPASALSCKVGLESVNGLCRPFGSRIKTYWNANDVP